MGGATKLIEIEVKAQPRETAEKAAFAVANSSLVKQPSTE